MDQKLLLLINREWTSPALDRLMAVLSSFDLWAPFLALAALAAAVFGGFRIRAFLVCFALALAINDGIVSNTIKHAVHRLRPFQAMEGVRQIDLAHANPRFLAIGKPLRIVVSHGEHDTGQGRSFPSSHTINNVTGAVMALLFFPRFGWLTFHSPGARRLLAHLRRVALAQRYCSFLAARYRNDASDRDCL